jgi:hypothetical protein
LFFARQIKDKTGSAATRKKALDREKVKTDSNHVPTSVDAYNDGALEEWFDEGPRDRPAAVPQQEPLGVNGVKFLRPHQVGFKDAAALEKAHKAVDLKYLRQTNRMAVRIFHDAVFEHPTKETAARTKLHSILQNNEVSKILRGVVDDADNEWIAQPWRIPASKLSCQRMGRPFISPRLQGMSRSQMWSIRS